MLVLGLGTICSNFSSVFALVSPLILGFSIYACLRSVFLAVLKDVVQLLHGDPACMVVN